MKMNKSKDGIMRATVAVKFRISEQDRRFIAFAKDYDPLSNPSPKARLANRAEVVEAIMDGFATTENWKEDVPFPIDGGE